MEREIIFGMRLGRDPIVHLYFLARDCHDWTYPGMVARGYNMAEDDVLPKIGWLNNYVKDKNGQELLLWFHSPPCCAHSPHDLQLKTSFLWFHVWWNQPRRLLQLPALTGRCSGRSALGGAQRTFWDTWLGPGWAVNPDGWDDSSPMKDHYVPYGFVWNLKDLISYKYP